MVGWARLVRNDIQSLSRNVIGLENVESMWVELRNGTGKNILVGVIYRPPNSSQDVGYKVHQEIEKECKKDNVAVVEGHISMQVDWENQIATASQEKEFGECLWDGFLEQLVVEPTNKKQFWIWYCAMNKTWLGSLRRRNLLRGSGHAMIEFSLQFVRERLKSDISVLPLSKEAGKKSWQKLIGRGS